MVKGGLITLSKRSGKIIFFDRPIHIISSNLHSVMNCFYAKAALGKHLKYESLEEYAEALSVRENGELREKVVAYALKKWNDRTLQYQRYKYRGTYL